MTEQTVSVCQKMQLTNHDHLWQQPVVSEEKAVRTENAFGDLLRYAGRWLDPDEIYLTEQIMRNCWMYKWQCEKLTKLH